MQPLNKNRKPCHTTGTQRQSSRARTLGRERSQNHTSLSATLPTTNATCSPHVTCRRASHPWHLPKEHGPCDAHHGMSPLCSSVPDAKRRVRRRLADLILAVVVTVASAAAIGVANRAVRRVPFLRSTSQMLQRGRCCVYALHCASSA